MPMKKKANIQTIFFSCFILIFLINIIADIIYNEIQFEMISANFLNHKLIEFFVLIFMQIFVLIIWRTKRFWALSDILIDVYRIFTILALEIVYNEFEIYKISQKEYFWYMGFIIGIFSICSLEFIKTKNLRIICFLSEMIYFIIRFREIYDMNIQRIITLTIVLPIIYEVKENQLKNQINHDLNTRKLNEKLLKNSTLIRILKDCNEEGLAVFNQEKMCIFNNEKLSYIMKHTSNLCQKLLNLQLKLMKITNDLDTKPNSNIFSENSSNFPDSKTYNNLIDDFFKIRQENSLEIILDKINSINAKIYDNKKSFTDKKQVWHHHLMFLIENSPNRQFQEEYSKSNLQITIFFKNHKIQAFFIHIKAHPDSNSIIIKEKENQNNKIFYVSHEMRTPLNCIVSMLQILKPLISDELIESYVVPAIVSCNFLLYLVQDLLDMAQLESDKFTINYEQFDIRVLISEIIDLFKIQAQCKNTEIFSQISEKVPEIVVSDHRRIKQILINLIGNSLKFIKKIDGKITIEVFLKENNFSTIIFIVKDNGIGVKEEDKKKLFKAFGKINNEETREKNANGVGLGLLISYELAKNLHPTKTEGLKLVSEHGCGTTFSFEVENKIDVTAIDETSNHNQMKNLNENYEPLLQESLEKPKKMMNFNQVRKVQITELRSESCDINCDEKFTSNSISRKMPSSSMKVVLNNNQSMGSFFLSLNLMKNSSILLKNNKFNDKILGTFTVIKENNRIASHLSNDQSFCDVFLSKRDFSNYEIAEKKLLLIKEINMAKTCKCPDILICDDNAFNVYSLKKQLECFSFNLESAMDGDEAIQMVSTYKERNKNCCKNYNIIFMDIEMPGKNGYETSVIIRKIHDKDIDTKIIACSSHLNEENQDKHKEFGMNEFVTKPIIKLRLIFLMAKYLKIESNSSN